MASKPPNRVDRALETHVKPTYMFLITGLYIVYILLFLGITYIAPQYIRFVGNFIHVLLAVILIIKFNPFRANPTLESSDGALIFGAAIFILINIGLTEFAMSFFDSVKTLFNIDMNPMM
jgi:hypothetical protein